MRTPSYTTEAFETKRDGLCLVGTRFVPRDPNGIPVILSHGFLGRRKEMARYAKALASWGCTAYTFDFAGGGLRTESDGRLRDMSLLTERAVRHAMSEDSMAKYCFGTAKSEYGRESLKFYISGIFSLVLDWHKHGYDKSIDEMSKLLLYLLQTPPVKQKLGFNPYA